MDELRLNLSSKFIKNMVAKFLMTTIRKQFGCDIDIQLNELNCSIIDGKAHIHVNVDADASGRDIWNICKSIGLEEP